MKIIFTKGSGKYDLMQIYRQASDSEPIECPKQGIIPHDMVHYAVEHTLKNRGFLGRLKDGETGGFQMQAESESDAVERLVEVFQGDEWSGGTSSVTDILQMYRVTCEARDCVPLIVDDAAIQAVRSTITELSSRWQAIPVGGALDLEL